MTFRDGDVNDRGRDLIGFSTSSWRYQSTVAAPSMPLAGIVALPCGLVVIRRKSWSLWSKEGAVPASTGKSRLLPQVDFPISCESQMNAEAVECDFQTLISVWNPHCSARQAMLGGLVG